MKLKVLEYAQSYLPKLFTFVKADLNGKFAVDPASLFNPNLCHDGPTVSDYINSLKEISDCDTVIGEFNQISELLNAAKLKGKTQMDYCIWQERRKKP